MTITEPHPRGPACLYSWRDIALFVAFAFGVTWSLVAAVLLAPNWIVAHFGPIDDTSLLFCLADCAPNIAAVVMAGATGSWSGLGDLLAGAALLVWLTGLRDLTGAAGSKVRPEPHPK